MSKYRMVGVPYGTFSANVDLVAGHDIGDEFDADFSEEQERALVGAGVIESADGSELAQFESPGSGAQTMDSPPHTADPGVGFQNVSDENVGDAKPAE